MYFGIIEDERDSYTIKHKLIDILKLVMISVLCGMDELDKMIDYGNNKKEFLEKEFEIKSIPSKATLTRIFVMIDSKWLGLSIVGIVQSLIKEKHSQIMIDGKAIKSTDAIKSIEKMMNIVTAYTNTGVSLLQKTVDNKTNEIPAVKELIGMLDVKGMIITADAMHCQKETAENLLSYTRKHWEIESMHHILDVTYDEDRCKLLSQRAQENLNIFRKMGISIHKNYLKNRKQTVKSNMFNCLLNDNLLLEVIGNVTVS